MRACASSPATASSSHAGSSVASTQLSRSGRAPEMARPGPSACAARTAEISSRRARSDQPHRRPFASTSRSTKKHAHVGQRPRAACRRRRRWRHWRTCSPFIDHASRTPRTASGPAPRRPGQVVDRARPTATIASAGVALAPGDGRQVACRSAARGWRHRARFERVVTRAPTRPGGIRHHGEAVTRCNAATVRFHTPGSITMAAAIGTPIRPASAPLPRRNGGRYGVGPRARRRTRRS